MKLTHILVLAGGVVASLAAANVPGGGTGKGPAVSWRDDGGSIVLDNGIVAIRIDKTDASIDRFTYRGVNLFEGGHGGKFYWSWNAPAYGGPHGTAALTVDPATNHGDYAEVTIHSPWSGKPGEAAMDVDVHYGLRRGAQGYYVAARLDHPASYPRNDVGEWRSNAYVAPFFDWLSVDALRQRRMPTVEDMAASLPVPGAPKEVRLLTSGPYAGQYECKYSYSADLGDLDVWGWSSTTRRLGIWMTAPSHEYYNGGPMKRELTAHMDHTLLNMLNGSHYSMGTQLSMSAGTAFTKTYGPYLVYANAYRGAEADPSSKVVKSLWADAQAQAAAERSAWPYAWFTNADYIQDSGRANVSGTLHFEDRGTATAGARAWIGLAPADQGTDFQFQGRTYQFWVKAAADGRFRIPHVRPGTYHLLAFGGGAIGTFDRPDVTLRAGEALDLGIVRWAPPRVAPTLWEIGVPDRDTHEFRDGAFDYSQWATYSKFAGGNGTGLTYTIGKSDWNKDWGYAQFGPTPWTINFTLSQAPKFKDPASLYIALASSDSKLAITVNGQRLATYQPAHRDHAPVRLGSHGPFSDLRIPIPAGLLKIGKNSVSLAQIVDKRATSTTQYDYIRLEARGARLKPS
jgi:rhamnogalacturonan endolyase